MEVRPGWMRRFVRSKAWQKTCALWPVASSFTASFVGATSSKPCQSRCSKSTHPNRTYLLVQRPRFQSSPTARTSTQSSSSPSRPSSPLHSPFQPSRQALAASCPSPRQRQQRELFAPVPRPRPHNAAATHRQSLSFRTPQSAAMTPARDRRGRRAGCPAMLSPRRS